MAEVIGKVEQAASLFTGQGDLIMFGAINDYNVATFASLQSPKSLGQIVQDSTEWSGEDPETTEIKDEQGNIITAKVAAGTLGFAFDVASTSIEMIKTFLNGVDIPNIKHAIFGNATTGNAIVGVGFGVDLPVMTRPLMIVNDEKTRVWLYPKAKITSNLAYSDGLWRIHATVVCEYLNLAQLKTAMLFDKALVYETA